MNRPIKFRIWDANHKKMHYSGLKDPAAAIAVSIYDNSGHKWIEVMQFIGKNDSKNKPIYEGDIVSYFEYVELGDKTKYVRVVKFCEGLSSFGMARNFHEDCCNYFWEGVVSGITVVGNFFENPELLNENNI
ncbi:MAG: YopX family protein [Nanoarchaeota archaeon]